MKLPKINFSLPKFLKVSTYEIKQRGLFRIWKKFLKQIPREFRSAIKPYQHFLVMGDEKSGKTDLIRNLVEQSQNIYPFEVEYTQDPDLQFYLGPRQIIQEISPLTLKVRTIGLRKSIIYLWKRLYAKKPPIVVIAYNCWLNSSKDTKEISSIARLIAGKLSLLSEIVKEPIKVRIALTHLDKLEGYLEFARFIKQHNIVFEIPLRSHFESTTLENALSQFRDKYLSLILTSTSADEFMKILSFFNQLPTLFASVEDFLRVLILGNISPQLELEKLTITSHVEPYTSLSSFDWKAPVSNSIFFRHPMLKHQLASAAVMVICLGLVLNNFFKDRRQVYLTKQGVDSLVYLQPKVFIDEVIPQIERLNNIRPQEGYIPILPRFYKREFRETNQHLAMRIRKHILEPSVRKILLKEQPELKVLYMLGLIHATPSNRLGYHILKNSHDWSQVLGLDEKLIKTYILSNLAFDNYSMHIEHLDKINAPVPLTSPAPWLEFLSRFQAIVNQPVFTGHNFDELRQEANYLLTEYRRLKHDNHAFVICNLLREAKTKILNDFAKNIQILGWLEQNSDLIESFLVFVCQTCPTIPDINGLNVSQFFAKLKDISELTGQENRSYNFLLGDEKFSFQTTKWVNLSVAHIIERLIHSYIVANNDTQGEIFFKHTPSLPDLIFESYRNEFPSFAEPVVINGRYSRLAFEKNVRYTTESLLKLLEAMPINMEDKDRFTRFIQQEVISYAKQYQKEYERVYAACNIRTSTLEEMKETLEKILDSSSSFKHFLTTINHHTEVFSDPPACLSNLGEINHFNFLRGLMSQVKNKKSPFERYQTLIENLLTQLRTNYVEKVDTGLINLEDHLTPAAKVALSILRNDPNSFLNQITENLTEIGVPPHYHYLFTAPVMQIYYLGIKDLKKGIDKLWAESLEPQLNALFAKRPFNPQGEMIATLEEVKKITNPTSEFVKTIKQIVAPASTYIEGVWYPNNLCDLQLDPSFYKTVNRLSKISLVLWDNEGNPQPIQLKVQSLPFKSTGKTYPAPILSYLVTGEETFHNFNQSPTWHSIKVDWWKENSSTVVVELANKNDNRSYRDEKVVNTLWSFFELLKRAEQQEKNVWHWELGNKLAEQVSHVALRFEVNPWTLFQLELPTLNTELSVGKNL